MTGDTDSEGLSTDPPQVLAYQSESYRISNARFTLLDTILNVIASLMIQKRNYVL